MTSERRDRAFETWFEAAWPRCRGLARRMGLSSDEAQDVALDALAIAYDRWSRVEPMAHRDAWVLKVTANLALRHLRRGRRFARRTDPESPPQTPDDRLYLRDALARLPRRQREVVFLRYLADLPESEVAAALGIDVGTVKAHANRGRAALRAAMSDEWKGESDAG
jgi:RNA polymerase sigma factor (sigma-70 family)